MKLIQVILVLLLIFLANFISSDVFDFNITELMIQYQKCDNSHSCKKIENKLVINLLKKTDILDVLEEMPDNKDIQYELVKSNISGSKNDYVIKIVHNRLGYVFVLISDHVQSKYAVLQPINTGYISNIKMRDITGDGLEEIIINGHGTGTGYASKWKALYKYRNSQINLIWSGIIESESVDINNIAEKAVHEITFVDVENQSAMDIMIKGKVRKIDTQTDIILEEQEISNYYKWSELDFKYLLKNKGANDL
jgi:hypothetical protein